MFGASFGCDFEKDLAVNDTKSRSKCETGSLEFGAKFFFGIVV